jgi:hypothetical protein
MATAAASGRQVRLAGRVKPRKKRVYQVLQLKRDGRWTTVGVRTLKTTRRGGYRGSFVPDGKGSYRVYVRTKRDSRNVASKSRRVAVKVRRGAKSKSTGGSSA